MRIAVGQMEPKLNDKEENILRAQNLLEEANGKDVEVLVLPELCNSGYVFRTSEEARNSAEQIPNGPMSNLLQEWTEKDRLVVAGICEQSKDVLYNSAAVFRDGEYVLTYRKVHLFLDEVDWFSPGKKEPPIVEYHGVQLGIMICFDWIFPEMTRVLALKGAQVILHPANLVLPYCQDAMITRSIENRVFTATANRIGTERGVSFSGLSQITDFKGKRLIQMDAQSVGIASVEIDPELAKDKSITKRNDIFKDRQPGVYRRITQDD